MRLFRSNPKLHDKLRNEFKEEHKKEIKKLTIGQKIADKITTFGGSWTFILMFLGFLFIWVIINTWGVLIKNWDPYPFILLNLVLSCLAAIQAPIILMSQNRESQRDRERAEKDYIINRLAEREVKNMQKDLDEIKDLIKNQRKKINKN